MEEIWDDRNIVFLMSLPRSGSTLMQRVLAKNPTVHSVSEPWILLPLLSAGIPQTIRATYDSTVLNLAVSDFFEELPDGRLTYLREVGRLGVRLFQQASPQDKSRFIEKTPRNVLFAGDLVKAFPNSKFVFLWRNPLSIVASIIETFGSGRWNIHQYEIDLFLGLENMSDACAELGDNAYSVCYENLINDPLNTWSRLMSFLSLDFDPGVLGNLYGKQFRGRVGDPTGSVKYSRISSEPEHKWHRTFGNPLRKKWARRYLNWIGQERLQRMGYSLEQLISELDGIAFSTAHIIDDVGRFAYGFLDRRLELTQMRFKLKTKDSRHNSYRHL